LCCHWAVLPLNALTSLVQAEPAETDAALDVGFRPGADIEGHSATRVSFLLTQIGP
jgi:hypothetical protein